MHARAFLLPCAALALSLASLAADDFGGTDFSLRLPAALNRFSAYGDVTADGGANSASKWSSSINPAALAWTTLPGEIVTGSVEYSNVWFSNQTDFHFISESIQFNARDIGVFQLSLGGIVTNERLVQDPSPLLPLSFSYDLWGGRLDWGKRLGDTSVGAAFGLFHSDTDFNAPAFDAVHARENIWVFRLGAQQQIAPKWLIGIVGDYLYGPTSTTSLLPTVPTLSYVTNQFTVRPGIAYEFLPNALAHLDFVAGWYENYTGVLNDNRFMAGIDIPLAPGFFLNTGAGVDLRGNFSWSAGIGFHPSLKWGVELAYQNNNFPELNNDFGRSQTLNLSVNFVF